MSQDYDFYLGSASPRRKALLESMGLRFHVKSADVDETRAESEAPDDYVVRVAIDKAKAVQQTLVDSGLPLKPIVAADTSVVLGDEVFGKPVDYQDACRMWGLLSGRSHRVLSSVVLLNDAKISTRLSDTDVEFEAISHEQMRSYWSSGEPQDKAGAYAIQGYGSAWVKRINGSYSGVVGMPLRELNELLRPLKLNWL